MNDPIHIKTKKIYKPEVEQKFHKDLIIEELQKNVISHMELWSRFQQQWCNRAYKTFKDYDKYLVLIYLISKVWQNLHDKFTYQSMDEFYSHDELIIEKINLIEISQKLQIPKETIRRKINEFQDESILLREGKSIILNKKAINYQRPDDTIKTLAVFSSKKFEIFDGKEWFGEAVTQDQINDFFKKYFTICWSRFFKLQIPFLVRWRSFMGDLETWTVWGNIGINSQFNLKKATEGFFKEDIGYRNYFSQLITKGEQGRGINASSISDISTIPRATVIRKLKWLTKNGLISKNKNLEYSLKDKGKKKQQVNEIFLINQNNVNEFLADILDLIKNSKFKI